MICYVLLCYVNVYQRVDAIVILPIESLVLGFPSPKLPGLRAQLVEESIVERHSLGRRKKHLPWWGPGEKGSSPTQIRGCKQETW
jgi:hypothetical protein